MHYYHTRTYIDQHGPIKATRADGAQLTIIGNPLDANDWQVEEIRCSGIHHVSDGYGFTVDNGEHDFGGYYRVSGDILRAIDAIALKEIYARELRHLLPAAKAQVEHYRKISTQSGYDLADTVKAEGVKVYGLVDTLHRQQARGSVFVCPTKNSGLTNCGHRVNGYMWYDEWIKFDNIQAWRVCELTREELMTFDPEWGDLVM